MIDRSSNLLTKDVSAKLKSLVCKIDVIESYSGEKINTNCSIYKLKNSTIFAALLNYLPIGCKDALLTKYLLKNRMVNCFTFEENTKSPYNKNFCLLTALALFFREIRDPKKKLQNYLCYWYRKSMDTAPTTSKESIWAIFLSMRVCWCSIFCQRI